MSACSYAILSPFRFLHELLRHRCETMATLRTEVYLPLLKPIEFIFGDLRFHRSRVRNAGWFNEHELDVPSGNYTMLNTAFDDVKLPGMQDNFLCC